MRVPHKGGHRVAVFVYALGRTGIHHHAPAAKLLESEIQDYKRADQKDGGLEDRCLEHTFHTADDCIYGGDDYKGNGGHPEIDAQKGLESKTACHNCHADLGEHVAGKREVGKDAAALLVVALLQELGHSVHHTALIERHEDPAENKNHPALNLPVGLGHSGSGTGTCKSDEVLRAYVGSED